jgi:hypothetical protein
VALAVCRAATLSPVKGHEATFLSFVSLASLSSSIGETETRLGLQTFFIAFDLDVSGRLDFVP